jgi:hypothetical protein
MQRLSRVGDGYRTLPALRQGASKKNETEKSPGLFPIRPTETARQPF